MESDDHAIYCPNDHYTVRVLQRATLLQADNKQWSLWLCKCGGCYDLIGDHYNRVDAIEQLDEWIANHWLILGT